MLTAQNFARLAMYLQGIIGYPLPQGIPDPGNLTDAILSTIVFVLSATVLAHAALELRELRRIVGLGYGIQDLRLALRTRRALVLRKLSWLSRCLTVLLFMSIVAFPILIYSGKRPFRFSILPRNASVQAVFQYALWAINTARWCWVIIWGTLGISFVVPVWPFHHISRARLGTRFWNTRLGAWLARFAAVGVARAVSPINTLHRPTELVLDLAIADLFHALPETMRQELRELPAVADSLRERAEEIKELLERLRLQLAGLSGEVQPTGALTDQLRDVRELDMELLAEFGAHPSIKRLLKSRGAVTPLTPAVS